MKDELSENVAPPAALPVGNWSLWANGQQGLLTLTGVDQRGNLDGEAFGNRIFGFWDEPAKKITFVRRVQPGDDSATQVYTGYLFFQDDRKPIIAGSFEAFRGAGGVASCALFGWAALQ
ncbi:MAG TPA: hypothetical protein VFV02_12395 [Acidimicrobiales bacterium]|nr:hypothetical protein [Acidimicrobiales bacterium]